MGGLVIPTKSEDFLPILPAVGPKPISRGKHGATKMGVSRTYLLRSVFDIITLSQLQYPYLLLRCNKLFMAGNIQLMNPIYSL